MDQVIKISDFMKALKNEGLLIVSAAEWEKKSTRKLNQNRNDLLKRKFLTIREMLDLEVLPIKTKTGVRHWIKEGIIKPSEIMRMENDIIKISTSFLKRKGYVE